MPIFHFDIADGVRLEDPVGLDCASEHDARKTADLIARQIAADLIDGRDEQRSVVVADEAGTEIFVGLAVVGIVVQAAAFRGRAAA